MDHRTSTFGVAEVIAKAYHSERYGLRNFSHPEGVATVSFPQDDIATFREMVKDFADLSESMETDHLAARLRYIYKFRYRGYFYKVVIEKLNGPIVVAVSHWENERVGV